MYRILPAIVLLILSLLTLTQASANLTSSADQAETGMQTKPLIKLSPKIRISQAQPQDQSHSITSSYRHDFSFLPAPALLLTKLQLDRASRVLGAHSGRRLLSDNEALIIQGSHSQGLWGIYRPLDTYVRNEQTVVVLKRVAIAELQSREKYFSTLQVRQQQQEILRDDVVLPLDSQIRDAHSSLSPVMENRLTMILGAIDGRDYVVKNQIVVLNRGQQEGVVQGSWFDLYQAPVLSELSDHLATDEKRVIEKLPSLSIGRLRVIDAEQYFSLALVTESRQPIGFDTVVQSSSSADSTHSLTAPIAIASGGEMR